ncbi:MAG: hypothetical protein ACSHXK_15140 [Oceanococcus sp.]
MINRGLIQLIYKAPALQWILEIDPDQSQLSLTLDALNSERTAYLISDADAGDSEATRIWISKNYRALFENELAACYLDKDLWPDDLTLELFNNWFDVECHSVVIDTVGEPILQEDPELETGPPDHLLN